MGDRSGLPSSLMTGLPLENVDICTRSMLFIIVGPFNVTSTLLLFRFICIDGLDFSSHVDVSDVSMLTACRAALEPRLSFFVNCFVAAIITASLIPSEKMLPFFDCVFAPIVCVAPPVLQTTEPEPVVPPPPSCCVSPRK